MEEKLANIAPGRLSSILTEGLRGYHLLFEPEEIRAAFAVPDAPLTRDEAAEVGEALLTICRDPLDAARGSVETLAPGVRVALIRLYFRLLDRAEEERRAQH